MKEFKDLLREIMEERDLKAVDVSELTGIGSGAVSMYLSGTRTPKVDTIRKLNPCPKMWKNRIGRNVKRKKNYGRERKKSLLRERCQDSYQLEPDTTLPGGHTMNSICFGL